MFAQESVMDIKKEREAFESVFTETRGWDLTFIMGCYQNIETLRAFAGWLAAKAQAVPEWISVEDKLPTENGNYLVCIDGDVFYLTAKWVKNHFKFLARGYGLTEDFTDWRYCEGVKVTHWMTLPAAPQEPAND